MRSAYRQLGMKGDEFRSWWKHIAADLELRLNETEKEDNHAGTV